MTSSKNTAFTKALESHGVQCKVVDVDFQRTLISFGAIDTHYIIQIRTTSGCDQRYRFKTFSIEKSFHDFRQLVLSFKKASKDAMEKISRDGRQPGWKGVPESTQNLIAFTDAFAHVIESEPISSYMGKISFGSSQELGSERRNILDKALKVLTENYPDSQLEIPTPEPIMKFISIVNEFFLTDHVYDDETSWDKCANLERIAPVSPIPSKDVNSTSPSPASSPKIYQESGVGLDELSIPLRANKSSASSKRFRKIKNGSSKIINLPPSGERKRSTAESKIVPRSIRKRRKVKRAPLKAESLQFYITNPNIEIWEGKYLLHRPIALITALLVLVHFFLILPPISITVALDVALVFLFGSFMIGSTIISSEVNMQNETLTKNSLLHPKRQRVDSETLMKKSLGMDELRSQKDRRKIQTSRSLISTTINTIVGTHTDDFDAHHDCPKTPLQRFPEGAEIGSICNCWSEPIYSEFRIRGSNYLIDKVKVTSGPFLFPLRGVDMFLSDLCPENIGMNRALLHSKLRDKPTFLINYRLPWGNFIAYNEIPPKFLPFLKHCYEPSSPNPPPMEGYTAAEICACRYFLADKEKKDQTLKIIPKVVKGPWIVRKTVDGKPAIVCNKMPTRYFYEPATEGKAEYFEVDLDIVASSAARAILAVAQRYTKSLTLDLGFVLQGNEPDELPEQMLAGSRIHGLDPLIAPMLPE